jgi:hypothetical protein
MNADVKNPERIGQEVQSRNERSRKRTNGLLATVNGELRTENRELFRGPSENYGSGEHTTVAAFLPWRGL